ncbi:hypothetical protein IAT38_006853 [Cryptococcus sp. DSM 104549]
MSAAKAATPSSMPVTSDTFVPGLFKGKVLFCTGGRSGICYKIVEQMMYLGVDAVIVGRDAKGLEESAQTLSKATGQKCVAAPADVRDADSLKKAAKTAADTFGKIDFVICGAAGNFLAPISGLSERAFRAVIEIDLLGTFHTVKATMPYVRQTQGSYLHISATLHYRGVPFQAHVAAAKAGVDALSQAIAVEEGPWGVRSNVIAPGPIGDTVGMQKLGIKGMDYSNQIPLGRQGFTNDIATSAIFLFSPAAIWITGQVLVVDGGENHLRSFKLPYPDALLDPSILVKAGKGKL